MTPWLALVNPYAARSRHAATRVATALGRRNIPADVMEVDGIDALRDTVAGAFGQARTRFVAVGGDGTINVVLNALLAHEWDSPPVLGILPTGTGCDLLRTFGIGNRIESAADRLVGETTYPVDVGLAIGEWGRRFFLNVASVGATAAAAKASCRFPAWVGTFRYVGGVAASLPGFRMSEIVVDAGKRSFRGTALTAIFANGQFFGGGFNIAPRASMVDQLLDVQIITARKREVVRVMPKARGGHHLTDPAVRRFVAEEIRVETAEPWPVEADGEPLGTTPLLVRLQTDRIRLKI